MATLTLGSVAGGNYTPDPVPWTVANATGFMPNQTSWGYNLMFLYDHDRFLIGSKQSTNDSTRNNLHWNTDLRGGSNWEGCRVNNEPDNYPIAAAYFNGKWYVGVKGTNDGIIYSNTTLQNTGWTNVTSSINSSFSVQGLLTSPDKSVLIAYGSLSGTSYAFKTTNGTTWTDFASASGGDVWNTACYINSTTNHRVAFGSTNGYISMANLSGGGIGRAGAGYNQSTGSFHTPTAITYDTTTGKLAWVSGQYLRYAYLDSSKTSLGGDGAGFGTIWNGANAYDNAVEASYWFGSVTKTWYGPDADAKVEYNVNRINGLAIPNTKFTSGLTRHYFMSVKAQIWKANTNIPSNPMSSYAYWSTEPNYQWGLTRQTWIYGDYQGSNSGLSNINWTSFLNSNEYAYIAYDYNNNYVAVAAMTRDGTANQSVVVKGFCYTDQINNTAII